MNILCSAEVFGFGPTSSLLSILRYIERTSTVPVTYHIIDTVTLRPLLPDWDHIRLIEGVCHEDLGTVVAIEAPEEGFDLVITAYDPAAAIYGWFHGIPSMLYEGLFHFWDFDSFQHSIHDHIATMYRAREDHDLHNLIEVFNQMYRQNPHEALFSGHFFADRCYIRKSVRNQNIYQRFSALRDRVIEKGCLHDPELNVIPYEQRTHWTVSTSGSLAPVISFEDNVAWARCIVEWAAAIAQRPFFRHYP